MRPRYLLMTFIPFLFQIQFLPPQTIESSYSTITTSDRYRNTKFHFSLFAFEVIAAKLGTATFMQLPIILLLLVHDP